MSFATVTRPGVQQPFDPRQAPRFSSAPEDARFLKLPFVVGALTDFTFEAQGSAVFFDDAPTTNGDLQISFDACFPFCNVRLGLFMRLRPFRELILRNTTGATITGSLIYSENPDFLVIQGSA